MTSVAPQRVKFSWFPVCDLMSEIDSEKRQKSQLRMNSSRLVDQMDNPVESKFETKRLFPSEQSKTFIRPLLDYYRHDLQVQA